MQQSWQEIYWLSSDGEVVYGRQGSSVLQSTDEWETTVSLGRPDGQTIQAIRDLDDGELLVSTSRNEDENVKGRLYKTSGYDRNDPSNTQFVEVLELQATQADITNQWGLDVHGNIVVASEYGRTGENGRRHSNRLRRAWTTILILRKLRLRADHHGQTAHIHCSLRSVLQSYMGGRG